MKKICGIYQIKSNVNNKVYVGQSINIMDRFVRHRYHLNKGIHKNVHLQRAWRKYGKENFEFSIIEECCDKQLDVMEEAIVNKIDKKFLYNISEDFTSRHGTKNPFFGMRHTQKSKNKMSEWKKKNYSGTNNPNYGKKHNKKSLIKMSENRSKTLNSSKILEIVSLLNKKLTHREIADKFNVQRATITKIANGTRWNNITNLSKERCHDRF
jgi:group I intron endonuclease